MGATNTVHPAVAVLYIAHRCPDLVCGFDTGSINQCPMNMIISLKVVVLATADCPCIRKAKSKKSYLVAYNNLTGSTYNSCSLFLSNNQPEMCCREWDIISVLKIGCPNYTVAFEHSVLHVWEIYALENAVLCIAVYGPYKP